MQNHCDFTKKYESQGRVKRWRRNAMRVQPCILHCCSRISIAFD